MVIYLPREDSDLLAKHVKKLSAGYVLDMGTGSGIQAKIAAKSKKVKKILAIDINKKALEFCKKNIKNKKISFRQSNLFSKVKEKFDTIIFNPPYLPQESKKRQIETEGGKKGWEVVEKFLNTANNYLNTDGIILLLFSSLTKKQKIDELIQENMFSSKEIDSMSFFYEKLFIYKIEKSKIRKQLEKKRVKNIKYLAKGKRGIVYTGKYKNKIIAIKTKQPKSEAINRIQNEANYLKLLNKHDIGPKLLFHDKNLLAYEFIKGKFIKDWIKTAKTQKIKHVLKTILKKCFILDSLQINKEEMHRPTKHILIGKKTKMIDFERARKTINPHNVSQFCQYIMSNKNTLDKNKIKINKNKIIALARKYKKTHSKKDFKDIISYFS